MPEPPGSSTQLSLVYSARGKSVVHPLSPGPTSIGSAADNDLVLSHDGVQPNHAVLLLAGGKLKLRDLFAGETSINDEACTSGSLRAGDVLSLGGMRLRVLRVATTSRRVRRPDPKDDTTKRASRRALHDEVSGGSAGYRRPSSRRMIVTKPTTSGGHRRPSGSVTSGGQRRSTGPTTSGANRRPASEASTSNRRRRPSGQGSVANDGPLTGSGTRRRSARSTKDWLGELNGDPEETQGVGSRATTPDEKGPDSEAQVLEDRVKRLTSRLRKAETRARSAQERLKHLEADLGERLPVGRRKQPSMESHLDLGSLHDLCTSMVDESDLEKVLELITDSLLQTFKADRAVLILTEEDGRNPLINVERVRGDASAGSPETGVAPEILEQTLHTRRPLEINGDEDGFGGLAAPILRSGRTFGILYFERTERGGTPIGRADMQLMSVFATLACLVIQPLMSEELT